MTTTADPAVAVPVDADDAFRAELRVWLTEHPPPPVTVAGTAEEAAALRDWQRTLHAGRWMGIHWPVEYGGRGASMAQVAVYHQELARAGAPAVLGRAGVSLVGPTLMTHGTEAQRERWMHRILGADDIWCQLFSEPDAGSDLAALATRAERRGDAWVVSGQKVWSSYATWATWGICLARTDPDAPAHRGISMLAVRMDAPGVEVRPLRQITGEHEFNEVFLDGVVVPVADVIGPEHGGWQVANTTLANERGATFVWKEQQAYSVAMERLLAACTERGLTADPVVRARLAAAWTDVELFRWHNARTLARMERGDDIGPESSLVKLFWAGMSQRFTEAATDLVGADALLDPSDPAAPDGGRWVAGLLAARANSIMGGTSEIQRNIIGERILGLPREPRPRTEGATP